ncbi:MAG: hypothetical protein ACRDZO_09500 [Egibacteraceae bacterium]
MNVIHTGRVRRDHATMVIGLAGIALAVGGAMWAGNTLSYNIWAGLIVAVALLGVSLPLLARAERDRRIARLLIAALVVRLAASAVRYVMVFAFLDFGDVLNYVRAGDQLAELFRQGVFSFDLGRSLVGTGFVQVVTGVVLTVTGSSLLGAFFIFAWLGYWGMYFFYRAFRTACPEGDGVRYAWLVLFMPSLVFWPAGIGKEAWMLLTLGLSAYGVARVLNHHAGGYPLLALGLGGVTMVRPHMSVLLCCGLVASYLARSSRHGVSPERSHVGLAARLGGMVMLAALSVVVVTQAERFFGVEDRDLTAQVDAVLALTHQRSTRGGSEFEATPVRSPLQLPGAIATVLLRPFPFEAHNTRALIASLEGVALIGLAVISLPRLRGVPSHMRRNPYVTFVVVYSLLFVVAFSNIGNLGLLARQRIQAFPILLVLFALPPRPTGAQAPRVWARGRESPGSRPPRR